MDIIQDELTNIAIVPSSEVIVDTSTNIDSINTNNLDITFDDNEYSIVGDDMVVVTKYDDAPQWLKDTIDNVVNIKTAVAVGDLNATKEALDVMLGELEVAKNTYQLSIVSSADIDSRITTAITSLNSALRDADATILEVANTAVTPSEASAIALNTLSASLSSNGEIGSAIHNLQTAMTTLQGTTATDISYLESAMQGEIEGNAQAMNTIRTYVGIDEAGASIGTGLSAYLEGSDGNFGSAGSKLNNDIKVTAEGIESKWAYNSSLNINGVNYNSGFGLATSVNQPAAGIPSGDSEFWIKADKFRLTAANNTISGYTPFYVNGTTGDVVFQGKVTFGSGQTGTIDQAIAASVETISVGDKNINITDNLIPTTGLVADAENSGYQFVGTPTKSNSAGLESFAEAQIVLDTGDEVYSLYVDEMFLAYYYRFGFKGTDTNLFKIITLTSTNAVTYSTITVQLDTTLAPGAWYIVDGIINPYGGDATAYSGSIRAADGTKVGSVRNFALPSNAVKLLLGWWQPCTISRMKLAKITADTLTGSYVTQNYVDNNIDSGITALEANLGSLAYEDTVELAKLGTTIVEGGYLKTDLIEANAITADKIDANAVSGKTISGGIITGTKLYGTQIEGAIIKASYIDLSSTATLTNWQQYTPANYPSAYDANFAKNNDGTLLVDSQGYVRLMGNTNILTQNYYYILKYDGKTSPAINRTDTYTVNLYSWNNYTVSTLNRMITDSHRVQLSSPSGNWSSVSADFTAQGMLYDSHNVLIQAQIIGDVVGEISTAYIKFNLLGDIFECYTYTYPNLNSTTWYMKKNSVTLYSGNTSHSTGLYTNTKNGLEYAILVGDTGYYGGGFPMIKVKFKSNDFTLSGLSYSAPFFVLIESTAVGNAYAYVIDIPNIKVV